MATDSNPLANGVTSDIGQNDSSQQPVVDAAGSRAAKKQHDAIVRWTTNQFKAIKNARTVTERQWYLNLAFYFGKQYVNLLKPQTGGLGNGMTTRLYTPPAPYYRSRPIINRIRPTIRHELAQLTNNKPTANIVPASAEERDTYAAQAGEQIWESLFIDNKVKSKIRRTVWWTLLCGTGFMKIYWDFGKKEICFAPETPFHILCPDLREEELENQPFLIHAQVKSPEWVKMTFPQSILGDDVNPKSADASEIIEDTFLNMMGTQTLNRQNSVLVLECWVKPGHHPMFPNGAFYTIIGDKIVQGFQQWPYSHNKYPFAKFDHIPGGKFYGTSSVEDLIPLQKEYNRTRGQIIEAKNRMAKPQLIAPRGSVDAQKITSEPGQVIYYTPGFEPPKPLPLQPLPNYVLEEQDRLLTDWNDISGQHEISQGQTPPGVTAATAISYLQERDESKLSPTFDSLEEGIEKAAQLALVYVHDYWDVERTVRVTGTDGSFDVLTFKGSDISGNLDIRIEAGSSLPQSKAAKQAFVMDLMKFNFISPDQGLEVMDMGGLNKIYERIQVDQRQAQRENLRMSKVTPDVLMQYQQQAQQQQMQMMQEQPPQVDPQTGQPMPPPPPPPLVPVNTWDNHQLHIQYHNQFRKGQTFESLDPNVQALFEQHVQDHIKAMGVESITQNPQAAAGLPIPPPGQDPNSPGGNPNSQPPPPPGMSGAPGPNPMPQPSNPGGQ